MTTPGAPRGSTVGAYDAIADRWDEGLGFRSPQFAARLRAIVVRMLGPAAGRPRAIELGAGTGWMLAATAPLFGELLAIEPSVPMLEICRSRIAALGLGNVQAIEGDALSLDTIAPASVDAVYAVGLLDAVPDPHRVLVECHRILAPAGVLVVSTSNGACPWYAVRDRLFGAGDVRTGRYLTPDALSAAARSAGLDVTAVETWGVAPPGLAATSAVHALRVVEGLLDTLGLSRWMGVLTASFHKPA